ncbi:MAG: hypothetical protein J1F71_01695, partial [Clostridiales bacterium]|nr:hypothetical protein [Clostridiales bacterium]
MDNQDKTTFSLSDDEEIVEEEVIDRDEEYDDGYDDEYDDDYDDYGDEEYDEDYDDYGDEGYNDDYYDDRLTKVLDELAELKRGMVPAAQQQQPMPIMPPQYIYQPTAPPAGSEVVMYNEISRLRDELARNQNSLEMQKELQRIKEDMARDQKFAEAQYQAEIQRLQSKIDDLLKNASSPQDELPEAEQPAHLEGGKKQPKLNLDKLLSLNEAILHAMRDSDTRIRGDIEQLKKQMEGMPSVKELDDAVSAIKKVVSSMDDGGLTQLSSELSSLKSMLEGGVAPAAAAAPAVQPAPVAQGVSDISAAELLRQLYEIKTVIGNTSSAAVKRAQTIAELVNDFKKVTFDVHSQSTSYKEKLNSVYAYAKRLTDSDEPDIVDLIEATNALIAELGNQPLDKKSFTAIAEYCAEHGMTTVTPTMRESADRFFNLVKKISDASVESYSDYLPDLVSELNTLQDNKYQAENAAAVGEITGVLLAPSGDKSGVKDLVARLVEITVADVLDLPEVNMPKVYKPSRSVNDETLFTRLADLKTAVLDRPPTIIPTSGDGELTMDEAALQQILYAVDDLKNRLEAATGNKDMSEALEELRNNYLDITNRIVEVLEKLQQPEAAEPTANAEMTDDERQLMLDDLGYIRAKLDDYEALLNNIADLRADMASSGMSEGAENSMQMVEQTSTLMGDITAQLDKLYEDLTNVVLESEANIVGRLGEGAVGGGMTESDNSAVFAETQAIKDSLAVVSDTVLAMPSAETMEQLRADINSFMELSAANTDAATADRQKLLDDIAFLREQAELALAESEQIPAASEAVQDTEKFISYLDEIAARVTLINTVAEDAAVTKDAVTSMVDSVALLTDNVTLVGDNVASVGATVSAVSENIGSIVDNVTAMHDSVVAMTDNVAVATENITIIGDNVAAVNDNVVAVGNNIAAINDNVATVNDNIAAVSGSISGIGDSVATVNDNVVAMGDNVVAARDAALNALDALAPISEQLGSILEKLDAPVVAQTETDTTEVQTEYASEELAALRENIAVILDTLAQMPQAEDVVAARDNTVSILDQLAMLPLADDVVLIRDNVTALHEAVNTLTETINSSTDATGDSQVIADEVTLLRETVDGTVADVKQILEKMSEYEQTALANKQEIIDTVSGIREEIHINTLDEGLSASGLDAETRDALLGEIADIRERLVNIENSTQAVNEGSVAAIDNISVQLATLQSSLEGMSTGGADSETMQTLAAEIAAIREKLDTPAEYDTVEEILSLRDDIKAARIVDQDEVASELEAIKNELAAISSGNMLDEIRALREDIANIPAGEGGAQATDGEINLVLNEIVSLRDEVFAFKDEVLNATASASGGEPVTERMTTQQNPEDYTAVLDEITGLRADQTALSANIDELKELLGGRATVPTEDGGEAPIVQDVSAVLEEIINLKNDIDRIEESLGGDRFAALSEQVEDMRLVLDELHDAAVLDNVVEGTTEGVRTATVDLSPVMEQLQSVNAALDEIKNGQGAPTQEGGAESSDMIGEIYVEIEQIKNALSNMAPVDHSAEIAELRAEVEALRAENAQLRADSTDVLSAQIDDLKDAIHSMIAMTASASDTSLIDEIRELKAQLATANAAPVQTASGLDEQALQEIRDMLAAQSEQHSLIGELNDIRDEIAQLRSLTTVAAESGESVEVQTLRNELAEIKAMLSSPDSLFGVAEDVTTIKADVQTLKDEPDLGVMSEILALRDEFQALREQIEDVKHIASKKTDSEPNDTLMSEVQSLRDQLFAISMANVNDPVSGESNYESYNNIILDELSSLRDQVSTAGSASDVEAIAEEVAALKAALDKREAVLDALSEKVAAMSTDVSSDRILEELASLRAEMANQRDADLATLNFMSEMAHLVERQNQYLTENAGANITDELERLKAELATGDAVAEEVAKLREVMTQSGNSSDNETILAALADLREELSKEKPSQENALILGEIARLRDEITAIAEREQPHGIEGDSDLSDSLSDLKEQLSEIAGIVEPAQPKQPAKKPTATGTGKKRGRKPGQGQKSSAKTGGTSTATSDAGKKPAKKSAPKSKPEPKVVPVVNNEQPTAQQEYSDLEALIDQQAELLGGDDDMSLNPTMVTADAMDLADKLAKQVANKLIMEQLVEQLGDGGVS